MAMFAAVGHAQELDGREAGLQATHQALNNLQSSTTPSLAIVVASHHYDAHQVATGVASLLGDVPTIGFSSPAGLSTSGLHAHSVVVGLLTSSEVLADQLWLSGYAQSSRETASRLTQAIADVRLTGRGLLLLADGFNGDAEQLCNGLTEHEICIAGALSSGDLHTGLTYQIAGNQNGTGGLAALLLKGEIRLGVGSAHGWLPAGNMFRVTRSRGFWVRTLDGRPASESYAQLFGYPAREWAFPPLNHMARLYPLGVERVDEKLMVRAPLRVEADGSFRMNASIRDGVDAHLLVGSPSACRQAAQDAAQQALAQLGKARPVMALVLADIAWQMLLEATPGIEVQAVQDVLGQGVPIIGGYTLGQIVPGDPNPQFLNQHIVVIVFGEPKA
jgi:hypothetical protein